MWIATRRHQSRGDDVNPDEPEVVAQPKADAWADHLGDRRRTGDGENDGGKIEASHVGREAACPTEMGEELAAGDVG